MPGWVTLDELVNEMKLDDQDIPDADALEPADAQRLTRDLDAAVEFVERVHRGRFNFDGAPSSPLRQPTTDLKKGVLMLAIRLDARRRSVNGLVFMGEQGVGRIPYDDPDISRLLRIGRHAIPRVR